MLPSNSLEHNLGIVTSLWDQYCGDGSAGQFVEFAVALNSLTDRFRLMELPGLATLCESIEAQALTLLDADSCHPLENDLARSFADHLSHLTRAIETARSGHPSELRREKSPDIDENRWIKSRQCWLVTHSLQEVGFEGIDKLPLFGTRVSKILWDAPWPSDKSPLVIMFQPPKGGYGEEHLRFIRKVSLEHPASQLFCLDVPQTLTHMVELQRHGAHLTLPSGIGFDVLLSRMMDLMQEHEREEYRVLLVDDSPTATMSIAKVLKHHGLLCESIAGPLHLLEKLDQFSPDLVLMDMHMPGCDGVEATRVLRQYERFRSLPVVYLSSETDLSMQIEALRLGGDQFLSKPCNPVLLAAVVNCKIERHRESQMSVVQDSMTGLYNHGACKSRLRRLVAAAHPDKTSFCVVMLDIDHFKSINDQYGHPTGDTVIRSLGWLLKGRLRTTDIVGRYGGEEFMVIMRNAQIDDAVNVIDRLRTDFERLSFGEDGKRFSATFSAGVAAFPAVREETTLIARADDALLQAKRNGRNRVERAT